MRLYSDCAEWFHLVTHPASYRREAEHLVRVAELACDGPARTLLELGSGGGNNASHLKARFACTLADLSPQMLALSRSINPGCEHLEGDMRTMRLGRKFDVVLIHDAICHMTERDDLAAAIRTAAAHIRPGGVAIFGVDCIAETFRPGVDDGGYDSPDGRSARYFAWTHPPEPGATVYYTDYALLLKDADGVVTCVHDRHPLCVFPRATWLALIEAAGLSPIDLGLEDPFEHERVLFVARRER